MEGRSCPLAYRYKPESLCVAPETSNADVLYVIGGLYGNTVALDEIERMAAAEAAEGRSVQLIFNGDFNWFNADDDTFRAINERVLKHTASLGNVDYELATPNPGAGCGCAYPDFVDQAVVDRSNQIIQRLRAVADRHPDIQSRIAQLPRYRCILFGGLKILVIHGDPESLAGWGLAYEAFAADNSEAVNDWFGRTGADVIACTHTCLPLMFAGSDGAKRPIAVMNNGSAGMGNLHDDTRGLISRLSRHATPNASVFSHQMSGLHLDLVAVGFDLQAWMRKFEALWPEGSAASESYRGRLLGGTSLTIDALGFGALAPTGRRPDSLAGR